MTIEVTLGRLSIVDCFTAISHAEDVVEGEELQMDADF